MNILVGKVDLAYAAGIIDGEGSIGIYKTGNPKQQFVAHVIVTNTNEWLLQWLKFHFGGSIFPNAANRGHPKWKDSWIWQLSPRQSVDFLKLVLPYLKIKKPQAELFLEFQARRVVGKHLSNDIRAVQEANVILMKSYNKKGK